MANELNAKVRRAALDALVSWAASSPNRIALSAALRGTVASVAVLLLLPLFGAGIPIARFAVIGALQTWMVDVGGPYRQRLFAMGANAIVAPTLIFVGMLLGRHWLPASLAMLTVALGGGLLRALGGSGVPFGLVNAWALLIGLQSPEEPLSARLGLVAGYSIGAAWTALVAMAFWQVRPYRRLEQEVANAWEAVSKLVAATMPINRAAFSVVARLRHEKLIAARHRETRTAIECARTALGEMRVDTRGPGLTMAQLLVLIRAASRVAAAALTLDEVDNASESDAAVRSTVADAAREIESACRAVQSSLLLRRGIPDVTVVRDHLSELAAVAERMMPDDPSAACLLRAEVIAIAQAVRHLDAALEALDALFSTRRRRPRPALPSFRGFGVWNALKTIRAQLTTTSMIFRHAVRVAVVAALATAAIVYLDLPHGIWLPGTALVILQPDFGATLSRAFERSSGTLLGALIASGLIATLHDTPHYNLAIAVLLFLTFLLLRRSYSWGITFLTPLIIMLLALSGSGTWIDAAYRAFDTLSGAGLAIVAGYLIWPRWQRENLADCFVAAIRADKVYLAAVLRGFAEGAMPQAGLGELRRRAEIEAANADAAFQRMMADPSGRRGRIPAAFAYATYVQRLTRHAIALAGYVGAQSVPADAAMRLCALIEDTLDDIATALPEGRVPTSRPELYEPLETLRSALADSRHELGGTVAFLLGQVVADATALGAVAAMRQPDTQ